MTSNSNYSRHILSSKRARGAEKKKKKLQALELQNQLKEISTYSSSEIPLEDYDKTDDDDEEHDQDIILIQCPNDFCKEIIPNVPKGTSNIQFKLSIPSYQSTEDGHIVYSIVLETSCHRWTFQKRYSEFLNFSQFLRLKNTSWQLPPKTWFRITKDTILMERQKQLEDACIELFQRDGFIFDPFIRDFFQLDIFAMSTVSLST